VMASAMRELITGFWGRPPGQGSAGEAPLKLKDIHFFDALRMAKFWPIVKDFLVVLKFIQQSVSSQKVPGLTNWVDHLKSCNCRHW